MKELLQVIIVVISIVVIYVFTNFIFKKFIRNKLSKRKETVFLLIINGIKYAGLIIGLLIVLNIYKVDTDKVLAGAGLLGILLGFGMQKLLQDVINGFFIIFENQYMVGEYIGINGIMGEVLEIGLKSTIILSYEGECHIVANGEIKEVINYSRYPSLAVIDLPFYRHEYTFDEAYNIIYKVVNSFSSEQIVEKPQIIGVQEINAYSFSVRIICLTKPFEQFKIMRDLKSQIMVEIAKKHE